MIVNHMRDKMQDKNFILKTFDKKLYQILHNTLLNTNYGKLKVIYPNNEIFYYGDSNNYECDIKLHNFKFITDI